MLLSIGINMDTGTDTDVGIIDSIRSGVDMAIVSDPKEVLTACAFLLK